MWTCSKCGESIDDVFDACWKCRTALDGTPVGESPWEPREPGADDPDPRPPPVDEAAAAADAARRRRVVELCSAANAVEARAIHDVLEQSGIECRVVGDPLANALPLGEIVSPRIWVLEEDLARAKAILKDQSGQSGVQPSSFADTDAQAQASPAGRAGFPWLALFLIAVGIGCSLLGLVWAGDNLRVLRQCTRTAEGRLVGFERRGSHRAVPPPEFLVPQDRVSNSSWYVATYEFQVDGQAYHAAGDPAGARWRMPVHYDPRDPHTNYVGSMAPSGLILEWTLGIGGSLVLLGCYLLYAARRTQVRE